MMNRQFLKSFAAFILAIAAVFGVAGQTSKVDDPATVKAAIAAVYDVYVRGVQTLDAGLWLTNWDENGVKFVPNAPAIVGKEAIANFARSKFLLFQSRKMTIKVDAIDIEGNLALVRGTYLSEDMLKSASAPAITDGWFLTAFKKQADGSWKIFRDCVASRVPPK
jgi:ketosteroid isomerase-like protein